MFMWLSLHKTTAIKKLHLSPLCIESDRAMQSSGSPDFLTITIHLKIMVVIRDDIRDTQVVKVKNIAVDVCFCVKGS